MGLYWHTLRLSRKNYHDKKGKQKSSWYHKGGELVAVLTTKCNLHCVDYCPMFIGDSKYPKYEVCTLGEWKDFFETYPEWLSQIYLSGGEPSFLTWLPELTNWLVDRGHHVIIFSNLARPENLIGIKKHSRFILYPTFHQGHDKADRFKEAYMKLKGKFRIFGQELEEAHQLSFTNHKDYFTEEWFVNHNKKLHAAPDTPRTGKLFLGCAKLYQNGK